MHLVSKRDQTVHIAGENVRIKRGEHLRTEYCHKYTLESFADLAALAGLSVTRCGPIRSEVQRAAAGAAETAVAPRGRAPGVVRCAFSVARSEPTPSTGARLQIRRGWLNTQARCCGQRTTDNGQPFAHCFRGRHVRRRAPRTRFTSAAVRPRNARLCELAVSEIRLAQDLELGPEFSLFHDEYRVPLLPPTLAAVVGTARELILPVLLIVGLAGGLSALGLFALNAIAVISYAHVLLSKGFEAAVAQHYLWGFMFSFSWCTDRGVSRSTTCLAGDTACSTDSPFETRDSRLETRDSRLARRMHAARAPANDRYAAMANVGSLPDFWAAPLLFSP